MLTLSQPLIYYYNLFQCVLFWLYQIYYTAEIKCLLLLGKSLSKSLALHQFDKLFYIWQKFFFIVWRITFFYTNTKQYWKTFFSARTSSQGYNVLVNLSIYMSSIWSLNSERYWLPVFLFFRICSKFLEIFFF